MKNGTPGTTDTSEKIGVLFSLADFYRKRRPELTGELFGEWRERIGGVLLPDFDLFFPDPVHDEAEFARGIEACRDRGCALVLLLPMAYTASGAGIAALKEMPLPLLIVSSSRDLTLPATMDGGHLFANQSLHGVQDIANVLRRSGRPFVVRAGHVEQDGFPELLKKSCRIGLGASYFFRGRVGQIGGSLPGMLDFAFDKESINRLYGFRQVDLSPHDLTEAVDSVDESRLGPVLDWIQETFTVDEDLTTEELVTTARYTKGLEDLAAEHNLDAVGLNFSALLETGCETLPFLGASRLLSRGTGYGGEGDVLTALLNAALWKINPETTFSELYCPDYGNGQIMLSHMGECNIALANRSLPVRLRPRVFPWGKMTRPGVPVFQMKPGTITITSISVHPERDTFQLITLLGEVVEAPEHPNLDVPYTRISLEKDMNRTIEEYSLHGGTHHVVVSYGDMREEISNVARFCGMEYYSL
jgi:L-arabinose isomerase